MRYVAIVGSLLIAGLLACVPQMAMGTTVDVGTATSANWTITGAGATNAAAFAVGDVAGAISLTNNGIQTGTIITGGSLANFTGYWDATTTFFLPVGATGVSFNFSGLVSDDSVVLELNGTKLGDFFLENGNTANPPLTGSGQFAFTDGTPPPETAYTFTGIQSGTISSGFIIGGTNTISLIVNNTGGVANVNAVVAPFNTNGDATYTALTGTVTYTPTEGGGVPLPPAVLPGMALLAGLGLVGAVRSRRIAA